jgi:hypothetical protein
MGGETGEWGVRMGKREKEGKGGRETGGKEKKEDRREEEGRKKGRGERNGKREIRNGDCHVRTTQPRHACPCFHLGEWLGLWIIQWQCQPVLA